MAVATTCDECGNIDKKPSGTWERPSDWVLVVLRQGSFDFCSEECTTAWLDRADAVAAADIKAFAEPLGFQRYDFQSGVMQIKRKSGWRYWATLSGQKCPHEHREFAAARACRQKMIKRSQAVS